MTKTATRTKRLVSVILITVTLLTSMMVLFAIPASAATKGKVDSSTYCTVNVSDKLIAKNGKQYAKVKINITDLMGWKNSAKIVVTLRDQNGRYITSFVTTGGSTIKLGDDHRTYRIYVAVYEKPVSKNWLLAIFDTAENFTNRGKAVNWNITNAKDCTIR